MLYATVFTLCVFSDGDQIDIIVCCRIPFYGLAGPHIGIQIKNPAKIEFNE